METLIKSALELPTSSVLTVPAAGAHLQCMAIYHGFHLAREQLAYLMYTQAEHDTITTNGHPSWLKGFYPHAVSIFGAVSSLQTKYPYRMSCVCLSSADHVKAQCRLLIIPLTRPPGMLVARRNNSPSNRTPRVWHQDVVFYSSFRSNIAAVSETSGIIFEGFIPYATISF